MNLNLARSREIERSRYAQTDCKDNFILQKDNSRSLKSSLMQKSQREETASDDFGFGAFTLEDYGTDQIITPDKDDIELLWKKGFCIAAVCARWLEFYFAVTETVEEYEGKAQTWQFSSSWS